MRVGWSRLYFSARAIASSRLNGAVSAVIPECAVSRSRCTTVASCFLLTGCGLIAQPPSTKIIVSATTFTSHLPRAPCIYLSPIALPPFHFFLAPFIGNRPKTVSPSYPWGRNECALTLHCGVQKFKTDG